MILLSALTPISEGMEYLGDNLLWGRIALYLFLALGVSFLCSLLEAIILSVTWSHIEILKKEEKGSGEVLKKLKEKAHEESLILAYDTEKLVGCVFANDLPRSLYIGKLAILPSYQGQGIGQRLVAACSQLAKKKGLKTLQLQTRIELIENQKYFGKLGFIKTAEGSHEGYKRTTNITMQCTVA